MKKLVYLMLVILLNSCGNKMVTEYYVISYGDDDTSLFETEKTDEYENEEMAMEEETKKIAKGNEFLLSKLKELPNGLSSDDLKEKAMYQAYMRLLSAHHILVTFTHRKNYDESEFFEKIKEYGVFSNELKKYLEDNEIKADFHQID